MSAVVCKVLRKQQLLKQVKIPALMELASWVQRQEINTGMSGYIACLIVKCCGENESRGRGLRVLGRGS